MSNDVHFLCEIFALIMFIIGLAGGIVLVVATQNAGRKGLERRAALQTARRDALKEAARRLAELHRNHKYNPQTGEGSEHEAGYYRAISEGAAWICALGEKE